MCFILKYVYTVFIFQGFCLCLVLEMWSQHARPELWLKLQPQPDWFVCFWFFEPELLVTVKPPTHVGAGNQTLQEQQVLLTAESSRQSVAVLFFGVLFCFNR